MSLRERVLKQISEMLNEQTDASTAKYKKSPTGFTPEDPEFTGPEQTKTDAGLPELTSSEKELPTNWGFEGPEQTKTYAGKLKSMPLFRVGSRGPGVKKLQTILATQGFDDELRDKEGQLTDVELSKLADGIYGQRTKKSVMKFQQIAKLPVTGVVSQKDWNVLKKWGTGKNIVPSAPNTPTPAKISESKTWADKTREVSASNLFERLVRNLDK